MAGAIICAKCGQKIVVGNGNRHKGKIYCNGCYDLVIQEELTQELAKEELYNYIKELFGKAECPSEIVYAIEQALGFGRKIKGIKATIYYYYEIAGNEANNIYLVPKVIREQYENAKIYIEKVQTTMEANKNTEINPPPICVRMTQPSRKKTTKYKMEDL